MALIFKKLYYFRKHTSYLLKMAAKKDRKSSKIVFVNTGQIQTTVKISYTDTRYFHILQDLFPKAI